MLIAKIVAGEDQLYYFDFGEALTKIVKSFNPFYHNLPIFAFTLMLLKRHKPFELSQFFFGELLLFTSSASRV